MSFPTGPYGPRDDLDKPKFGEASPLKSKLPPGVGRGRGDADAEGEPILHYLLFYFFGMS